VGNAAPSGFPTTSGAYREDPFGTAADTYVARLTSDLSSLVSSTFVAGALLPQSLAVDSEDNVFIGGAAGIDFGAPSNSSFAQFPGQVSAGVIVKVTSDFSQVSGSTFLRTTVDPDSAADPLDSLEEYVMDLTVDADGTVFATGTTSHLWAFATTEGALLEHWTDEDGLWNESEYLGFAAHYDADLTGPIASTLVGTRHDTGHGGQNEVRAIALGGDDNVLLTGLVTLGVSSDVPGFDQSWSEFPINETGHQNETEMGMAAFLTSITKDLSADPQDEEPPDQSASASSEGGCSCRVAGARRTTEAAWIALFAGLASLGLVRRRPFFRRAAVKGWAV